MEASTVISGLSLTLSLCLAFLYLRDRERQKYNISSSYIGELLAWHRDVVFVLANIRSLKKRPDSPGLDDFLAQLSALIEQGRFYFPNITQGSFGEEKLEAYQGHRNLALDFLVLSYRMASQEMDSKKADKLLEDYQKNFTSIVFQVVRPASRLVQIKKLTNRYFVKGYGAEDVAKDPSLLSGRAHSKR
jgi:hypothetical protein